MASSNRSQIARTALRIAPRSGVLANGSNIFIREFARCRCTTQG